MSEYNLVMYTKPNCPQCDVVKLALYRGKIKYTVETITPEILSKLQTELNHTSRTLPILVLNNEKTYSTKDEVAELINSL